MIVQSFRSVLWVGAVAGAAISCYMVSLRVAAERAALERVETQILIAKRDIRSLDTELTTRGRLRQLERWNSDVLALTAPTEGQFLEGEVQLASLNRVDPKAMPGEGVRQADAGDAGAGDGDAGDSEGEGERFMHAVDAPEAETQTRPILADYKPARSAARLVKASVTKDTSNARPIAKALKDKTPERAKAKPKVARNDDDKKAPARKPAAKASKNETAAVANKKAKAKTTT